MKPPRTHLLAPSPFLERLDIAAISGLEARDAESTAEWRRVKRGIGAGDDLIVIGTGPAQRLESLWVQSYNTGDIPDAFRMRPDFPYPLPAVRPHAAACRYGTICPPVKHVYRRSWGTVTRNVYHGVDEEPRADFHPLMDAFDRFGNCIGHPAFMLKHTRAALATNRYRHSAWSVFLFDEPAQVLSVEDWQRVLGKLVSLRSAGPYFTYFNTEYARYAPNETGTILCEISNRADEPVSATVTFSMETSRDTASAWRRERRLTLNADETITLVQHFPVSAQVPSGYRTLRASLCWLDRRQYGPDRLASERLLENRTAGFWMAPRRLQSDAPAVAATGTRIAVDDDDGFHLGTHFYATNCFTDWNTRRFRLDLARTHFMSMRENGMRFVRLWVDPILDEETLRALDACIACCRDLDMVVILTLFTQWTPEWGIDLDGRQRHVQLWSYEDYNLSGISLRNIEFQEEFVGVLAERYRAVSGLVWNLSNEAAVIDMKPEQLAEATWLDPRYRDLPAPQDSVDILCQWIERLQQVFRHHGASQPVIGTSVWASCNGSTFYPNQLSDIGTQHDYSAQLLRTALQDLGTVDKPLLLEEFGLNTDDDAVRLAHYDEVLHRALGYRTAGAVSYEWGVAWLADQLPAENAYWRYPSTVLTQKERDPGCIWGFYHVFPIGSLGACAYAASFQFASIYNLTTIPTEATRMMQRFALVGRDLGHVPKSKPVWLVVPNEWRQELTPGRGRKRKTDLIEATLDELQAAHVDYAVAPEEVSDRIPDSTAVVIVPCENPPSTKLQAQLDRLKTAGAEVYTGRESWQASDRLTRVSIRGGAEVSVQVRDLADGVLYVLLNRSGRPETVTLTHERSSVKLEVAGFGMAGFRRARPFLIEGRGSCTVNGAPLVAAAGGRWIMVSRQKAVLDGVDGLDGALLLPLEPMRVELPGRLAATAVGITSPETPLADIRVRHTAEETTVLDLDTACTRCACRLRQSGPASDA